MVYIEGGHIYMFISMLNLWNFYGMALNISEWAYINNTYVDNTWKHSSWAFKIHNIRTFSYILKGF